MLASAATSCPGRSSAAAAAAVLSPVLSCSSPRTGRCCATSLPPRTTPHRFQTRPQREPPGDGQHPDHHLWSLRHAPRPEMPDTTNMIQEDRRQTYLEMYGQQVRNPWHLENVPVCPTRGHLVYSTDMILYRCKKNSVDFFLENMRS